MGRPDPRSGAGRSYLSAVAAEWRDLIVEDAASYVESSTTATRPCSTLRPCAWLCSAEGGY